MTHDIKEALYLGERVIVMKDGVVEQFDTAQNIRNHPNCLREAIVVIYVTQNEM